MSLPKLLILGQPFNNNSGGGITLTNLLSGWDKDKLAVACSGYLINDHTNSKICDNYYQLGSLENKWAFPFNIVKRKYYSGPIQFDQTEQKETQIAEAPSKSRVKLIMDYVYPMLDYTGLSHVISRTQLSPQFKKWLDDYQPDILYAQFTSLDEIHFCIEVHQYLGIPLVYHMMDDWPLTIADSGPFKNYWTNRIDLAFRKLLDRADLLLSISDHMSEEYLKRYGKKFTAFHNPIDTAFWKQHQRTTYELPPQPTILYAGRTGLGIDSSLKLIAAAVQEVNQSIGSDLKFVLQTGSAPNWINEFNCVEHRNFVPYSELPRVFGESDFMILPYDFSDRSIRYIRYSMPTKASEYMVSGSPIIVFSPDETAIVRYANQHGWAEVITENSVSALANSIKALVQDKERRSKIAETAKTFAEAHHDAQIVTTNFKNAICSVLPET